MSTNSKITDFEIRGEGDHQVMAIARHIETHIPGTIDAHGYYTPARLVINERVRTYPLTLRRHQDITRAFDSVYGPPDIVDIKIYYEG